MKTPGIIQSANPSDELKNQRVLFFARNFILSSIILLLFILVIKIIKVKHFNLNDYTLGVLLCFNLISLLLVRNGKVILSWSLYMISLWISITFFAWTNGGIRGIAVMSYFVYILMTMLTFRKGYFWAIGLLSILSIWVLTYAEYHQIIIPSPPALLTYAIGFTIIMCLVFTLLYLNEKGSLHFYRGIQDEFSFLNKSERNSKENEVFFRSIFENSNDSIFIMKEGKFVECNPKTLELFSCTREQIINQTPIDFSPQNQPDGISSKEKANNLQILALEGNAQRFEWLHCRFDKSPFDAEVSLNRIEIRNEFLLLAIVRDISERKQIEKTLYQERALFRTIIDNIPDPVYAKDVNARKTVANLADVRNIGASSETEILNKDDFAFFPKEIAEKFYADDQLVLQSGKSVINTEDCFSGNSGEKIWYQSSKVPFFDDKGQILGLVGIAKNISERKMAEESQQMMLRLQAMLMKMSATFINIPLEDIDNAINSFLEELGKFVGASRVRIWEYNFNKQIASLSYEWCSEDIESKIADYKALNINDFKDFEVEKHLRGEIISVIDVNLLPSGPYKEFLIREGDKSAISIPIIHLGKCVGFVSLNWTKQNHTYTQNELSILNFFAHMIANVSLRRESEQELLQTKARLSRGEAVAGYGNWELNYETLIMEASEGAMKIYGATKSKLTLEEVREFILPEYHSLQGNAFRNLVESGEPYNLEFKIRHGLTGDLVDIQSIAEFDPKKRIIFGTIQDITERNRAFHAIRESEEKLRAVFDSSIDAIGVAKNGIHIFANPSYLKLFGYENNDKLIGTSITDCIAPNQRKLVLQYAQKRYAHEPVPSFYESRGLKSDGTEFDAEFKISTYTLQGEIFSVATIRDITERKKAEEELRKLFHAIEQSPVSIVITSPNGEIEYINPQFTKITGYAFNEVKGQNPRILKSGHTSDLEYRRMWAQISSGGEWRGEFYNKKKNGEFYWEAVSISPVINDMGVITNYIAVKEDITKQKESDRRIMHAIIEAEENERNRFSRELHDGLGPVMSAVKLYFHLLAENNEPDKKNNLKENGNRTIDEAIQLLREISNNLSPRNLTNFGLVNAIKNFINLLNETKRIVAKFTYNTERRYEKNLEITLYRITTELINNALKYSESSKVEIKLNYWESTCKVTLDYVDLGKGFDLQNVMNARKGLGLLNIQQRVSSLNGIISFTTAPGKGLQVHVELPVDEV